MTEYVIAPDKNGAPSLPKRAGTRSMLPSTWIDRTLRIEYEGAGGASRETTATLLDWSPVGLLLNIAGALYARAEEYIVRAQKLENGHRKELA